MPKPRNEDTAIEDVLTQLAGEIPADEWSNLPADLTDRLDHYLYGNMDVLPNDHHAGQEGKNGLIKRGPSASPQV